MLYSRALHTSHKKLKARKPVQTRRRYSTEPILLETDAVNPGVKILKFNNPKKLNPITAAVGECFVSLVSQLSEDPSVRAVVLTGEGRAFSAGGDLDFLLQRTQETPHNNSLIMRQFYGRFLQFRRRLHVPVIAAINGHAVGAGLCLAAATDIRFAASTAKMGVNFVALGLHPGMGGSYFLPKLIGQQAAARLLLTGDLVTAEEAKQLGLVLDVFEPEKLMEETLTFARKIAVQSPEAVKSITQTLRMSLDADLDAALQREADAQALSYASAQYLEGVIAVQEKRKPNF